MKSFNEDLGRSFFSAKVHGTDDKIFNDVAYKQISHKVDFANEENTRWVSLGSHSERERLFLDQNSEFVSTITKKITSFFSDRIVVSDSRGIAFPDSKVVSIQEVLEQVNNVIDGLTAPIDSDRSKIERDLDLKLDEFLKKQKRNSEGCIDITLDELAQKNLLVCRHKGLLAASILGSLVKNKILPFGHVHQYRSNLYNDLGKVIGAHTWAVYRVSREDDIWVCDPRWLTAEKANSSQVRKKYGEDVIDTMIKKLNKADNHVSEELTRGMIFDFSDDKPAVTFSKPLTSKSSLIIAAKEGDMEHIVYLCRHKEALNIKRTEKDSTGKTALHYLAEKKDSERAIIALLNAGSWTTDPTTIQDNNGNTPLHILAKIGNDGVLKSIDRHFTAPGWFYGSSSGLYKMFNKASFYKNQDGLTPIMVALTEQPNNARLISKLLIAMGAMESDINVYKQLQKALSTNDNALYAKIKSERPYLIGWHWDTPLAKFHKKAAYSI